MAIIFQSYFDNPVPPFGWTSLGTANDPNNTVTVSGGKLVCTYSTLAVTNSHAAIVQACGTVPNHDHLFARAYCTIDRGPPSTGSYKRHNIFGFHNLNGPATSIVYFGIGNDSGILRWEIYYRNAGAFSYIWGGVVNLNTEYCMDVEILQNTTGLANGAARLWINGTLMLEVTALTNDDRAINYTSFGFSNSEMNPAGDQHFTGDAYILADQYIGPESGLPKLTVNSNPELNIPVYVDGTFVGNTPITVAVQSGTHTVRVDSEVTK